MCEIFNNDPHKPQLISLLLKNCVPLGYLKKKIARCTLLLIQNCQMHFALKYIQIFFFMNSQKIFTVLCAKNAICYLSENVFFFFQLFEIVVNTISLLFQPYIHGNCINVIVCVRKRY